ncbi:ABC transporter permease [Longimycelium tulufanense]|uniref:ABC transporter permease n=1 Tax=Longimycelium tulufanense TaxID=907463 RepID=A0A8J3FTP2_9PSEU|nr:ABC transporter permease subunit [Longimycelium tulufanense]GGM42583.1 ABC transporter permease [Longimycelium tulufanense]
MLPLIRRAAPTRPARTVLADVVVAVGVLVLLWVFVELAAGTTAPITAGETSSAINTDPANLPYYAGRSMLRMFVALVFSTIFAFAVGIAAARSRRAEKLLVPALDILQSVPILGFLSVTVTFFIGLFPGSTLGLEAASVFAIFTSQAWNMAFAVYQALTTQPRELDEAARMMGLTRWQRFVKVDAPSTVIPLTWNALMSLAGGWFFLSASEAITLANKEYTLPGLGSYVLLATREARMDRVLLAIAVMVLVILAVNTLFARPLTAWAERFRVEEAEADQAPRSVVLDLLRRSRLPRRLAQALRPLGEALDRAGRVLGRTSARWPAPRGRRVAGDTVLGVALLAVLVPGTWWALDYVTTTVGWSEVVHASALGLVTFGRVLIVLALASLVWVPLGVWIGMNPRVTRFAQPVVQVLASFPANFLFPFATALLLATHVSLDWGGIALMSLGAQWYILFNVIAGASAIPTDLREAVVDLGLSPAQRWRYLVLPAVLPAYVTGGLTAAGGAWNASIVAEVADYGDTTLHATGLGAYITAATEAGLYPRIFVGVVVMSAFVVALNRLVWRPLQRWAHTRFAL